MPLPPDTISPPLLNPIWAVYIGVIATILIGIFFTKDDKRNFENIVSNIVSFALLLVAVQFTWLTLMIMTLYLIVGVIIAIEKKRKWFFLFGSKTYGTLALMILLVADRRSFFGFRLEDIEFYAPNGSGTIISIQVIEGLGIILLGWLIMALVAHTVGYIYWQKPFSKMKKARSKDASLLGVFSGRFSKRKGKRARGRSGERGRRRSGKKRKKGT